MLWSHTSSNPCLTGETSGEGATVCSERERERGVLKNIESAHVFVHMFMNTVCLQVRNDFKFPVLNPEYQNNDYG